MLLLAALAVISLAATMAVSLGAAAGRRDAERALIGIGMEFQEALRTYAGVPAGTIAAPPGITPPPGTLSSGSAMPPGNFAMSARGPRSLENLLRDPRVPGLRRHLRQVYADPLTGKAEWGLVLDPQGFIVGIHSLAEGVPIQQQGFDTRLNGFEDAKDYRQWVFGLPQAQAMRSSAQP